MSIRQHLPGNPNVSIDYAQELWGWFNRMITYTSDEELYDKVEWWTSLVPQMVRFFDAGQVPVLRGDCEDYTLTMADMLLSIGWPRDELLIVRCASYGGSGRLDHAILWIRDGYQWVCADCWDRQTRSKLYAVGGIKDPGHDPIDAQTFPIKKDGWRRLDKVSLTPEG